jgi:hypothetical protein
MSLQKHWLKARTLLALFLFVVLELYACTVTSIAQEKSRTVPSSVAATESLTNPASVLSTARTLYVRSRTVLVKTEVIESELQKRSELKQAGLVLTHDNTAADLIMEVRRSNFTTEYPYVVIDARTQVVVASGKVNSLFGTAAAKIAKGFAKQLQKTRAVR